MSKEFMFFGIFTEFGLGRYAAQAWMVDLITSAFAEKENAIVGLVSEKAGKILYGRDKIIKIQVFPERVNEEEVDARTEIIKISDFISK